MMTEHFSTAIHKATMQFSLSSLDCRFLTGQGSLEDDIAQKCLLEMPHCEIAFGVSRT